MPGRFLVVPLLALAALCAPAQELFLWTDEHGISHLSDRRPDTRQPVIVQRAIAAPESPLELVESGTEHAPEILLRNRLHGTLAARVVLDEARNLVSDPELPAVIEIPAAGEASIVLGALDERRGWSYRLRTEAVPGPLDPEPEDVEYGRPIPDGIALHIGQGAGGDFSHDEPHSRHAVDIALPVGTPVLAARAGVVMDAESHHHRAGLDRDRDGPRANFVRILHADGTMAVYAHLDYLGVSVRPGQRVADGDRIGTSGNTGYSTGPHLHFAVQVNRGMELVSIPFRFAGEADASRVP